MPSYEDDWDLTDFTGDDTEDECYEDDNESFYSDYDDITSNDDKGETYQIIKQPVWKNIMIGGYPYMVSDLGCVKKPDTLFEVHYGIEEPGTPFRTITFPSKDGHARTFYIHDLVWQTFNGDPPIGWEVRHTFQETRKNKRYYSNALHNLTIMPIHVVVRPKIFI